MAEKVLGPLSLQIRNYLIAIDIRTFFEKIITVRPIKYHRCVIYLEFLSFDAFLSFDVFAEAADVSVDPVASLSELTWAPSLVCDVCGAVELDDASEDVVVDDAFGFSNRSIHMFALLSIDLAKFKRTSIPNIRLIRCVDTCVIYNCSTK